MAKEPQAAERHQTQHQAATHGAAAAKSENQQLLEDLYADAVSKGRRDEPLIVKLGEAVAKGQPKKADEKTAA